MKYDAKITLMEANLREIIAEYFGVDPKNVRFTVTEMQRGNRDVGCEIKKEMEFPKKPECGDTINIPIGMPGNVQAPHYDPWHYDPCTPTIYTDSAICGGPLETQVTLDINIETEENKDGG